MKYIFWVVLNISAISVVLSCSSSSFFSAGSKSSESKSKNAGLEVPSDNQRPNQENEANPECLVGLVGFYLSNNNPVWKIVSSYPQFLTESNDQKSGSFARIAATEKAEVVKENYVIEENFGIFLYPRIQVFDNNSPEIGKFFSRGFLESTLENLTGVQRYGNGLDLMIVPEGVRVEALDENGKALLSRDGPAVLIDSPDYNPYSDRRGSLQVLASIKQYPKSLESKLKSSGYGAEKVENLSSTKSVRVSTRNEENCPILTP